eukprot:CFRG1755T1
MPIATLSKGIELHYEEFGVPTGAAIVLIMGLNMQSIAWNDEFCIRLAKDTYRVIRFDNRDCGLSQKFIDSPKVNLFSAYVRYIVRAKIHTPYTLLDMSDDVFQLMDFLKIEKAHMIGASMGGMLAQICAIENQSRVLSLTSIMSTTGDRSLPGPQLKLVKTMLKPRPTQREPLQAWAVNLYKKISHPVYWDDEYANKEIEGMLERSMFHDSGRQTVAIMGTKSRTNALQTVSVPSLVIHGASDPLLPVAHGKATAKAIPGSKLVVIDTMGHNLPIQHWERIMGEIHSVIATASVRV